MLRTSPHGIINDIILYHNTMIFLVALLQSQHYLYRVLHRRLCDIHLLKSACYAHAASHMLIVFLVSGSTDKSYVATLKIRLQHIRCIQRTVRDFTSTHYRVNLIYIYYGVALLASTLQHQLQFLFKLSTILSASYHRAHIHHIHLASAEPLRTFALYHSLHQAIYNSRLAHTRLTNKYRIVLITPT